MNFGLQEALVDQQPEGYYERVVALIKAGNTVWMRRNFEADAGATFDLFSNGKHLGYIDADYSDPESPARGFWARAYVNTETEGPEPLDDDARPTAPTVAAFALEQYFRRRGDIA